MAGRVLEMRALLQWSLGHREEGKSALSVPSLAFTLDTILSRTVYIQVGTQCAWLYSQGLDQ